MYIHISILPQEQSLKILRFLFLVVCQKMLRARTRVSSLCLVLLAITCAVTAVHMRLLEELDTPNQFCNGDHGTTPGPEGYDCTHGSVCIDTARMIRGTCKACHRKGSMTSGEYEQCQNIVPRSTINTVKGVEVYCESNWHRRTESGCFFLQYKRQLVGPIGV